MLSLIGHPRYDCNVFPSHDIHAVSFYSIWIPLFANKHIKGTSINHLGEVRLFITRYKPKAQCRDIQISENCVPKGRDIYSEFIEPT